MLIEQITNVFISQMTVYSTNVISNWNVEFSLPLGASAVYREFVVLYQTAFLIYVRFLETINEREEIE